MKLRISVDPNLCYGAAACVTVSPEHFQLNEANKAEVMEGESEIKEGNPIYERVIEADDAKKDEIVLAAQSCPVAAISVWNLDTGEKLFP